MAWLSRRLSRGGSGFPAEMAARKLKRLGLNEQFVEALQRHGFVCCKDLLLKTRIELVDILDMDEKTVDELLAAVYRSCCPDAKNVASMRSTNSSLGPIDSSFQTNIQDLDLSLRGGLPRGR